MTQNVNSKRVLIVDDDAMSRELLQVLLEAEGYTVTCANSGNAALTLLTAASEFPEIVLSDINMPGITGSALAAELRRLCSPSTLLLAMSGSQPSDRAVAAFDAFLLKPFQLAEIASLAEAHQAAIRPPNSVNPEPTQASGASNQPMETYAPEARSAASEGNLASVGPVLNETIYQQLAVAMPTPQLLEMYTMCVNDARERIATMRALLANHDDARFVREAHAIKGSCGMLGATQLHGMAAELERGGTEVVTGHGDHDVNSLDELSAACDRLERMLGSRV